LVAVFAGLAFVPSAWGQTVSVYAGNGQVLGGTNFVLQPLVVQVTDSSGTPVGAGVTVNWQGTGFNGVFLSTGTNQTSTSTDANGLATAFYSLPSTGFTLNVTSPFIQNTITASAGGNTAAFTLTQLISAPQIPLQPYIVVVPVNIPAGGTTLTGAVGTASTNIIQLQVGAGNGQSLVYLPNAAIELLNFQDPTQGPLVACATNLASGAGVNTVLTDATGNATCTPVFGGQPGQGQFAVTVGGVQTATFSPAGFWQPLLDPTDPSSYPPVQTAWINFPPFAKLLVTPGAPGSIKILTPTGGTQSVTSGGAVSLAVEVDNAAGLPVSGSTVNWKVVSPATGATLSTSTTTSDNNGRTVNTVTIASNFSGAVQVTATLASAPTKSVTFNVSASPPVTITQFQQVSGANQTAVVNSAFGLPLVVKVSVSAGSPANIPVQFQVLSGTVGLSASTVNTDANGLAQVNVTAGSVTGPVSVTASANGAPNTVSFALTVLNTAPTLQSANFVNGADLQTNSLSPCSLGALVTSPGTLGIANSSAPFPAGPVPSSPLQLSFANIGAPIVNINSNASGQQQVLFQVPCEVAPGSAVPVTISVGGTVSNVSLNVQAASPGIFQTKMSDGVFRALLVRPDGSYVSLANPARQGEIVVAYVTGLGPTTPGVGTNSLPAPSNSETTAPDAKVLGQVIPGMSGGSAPLIYARLSEDLPGVYVVAFQIPTSIPTGNDVTFSIGVIPPGGSTAIFSATSKVPVHQ
jgi:uncharacterized protein (TIGR03437 family)